MRRRARTYDKWKFVRNQSIDVGRVPTTTVFLATDDVEPPVGYPARVEVVTVPRSGVRPKGRRFGSLVHLIMRDVDLRAAIPAIDRLARAHARLLNATDEEIAAATQTVTGALQHPLLLRAQRASSTYRELPISTKDPAGNLIEGVIDLAFVVGGAMDYCRFQD